MTSRQASRVVRDVRFDRLVPGEATLELLADGTIWGEGPVYLPDADAVLWTDLPNDRVLRWSAVDGVRDFYRPSDVANGQTLDLDGRVLACEHATRRISRHEPDGSRTTVVDRYEGKRLNSPNDLIVASDGAIWFTDPPLGILDDVYGRKAESELGYSYIFRLDRARDELKIMTGVALTITTGILVDPNGLALSPDESTLYVTDTSVSRFEAGNHHILAFDVLDGPSLGAPRVFAVIEPGFCDGIRVDAEGNVWASAGDGVHVLDPDGVELGRILTPEPVGNLTFGGPDGRRLFIAATSSLWSIQVGVRGAATPWAGETA